MPVFAFLITFAQTPIKFSKTKNCVQIFILLLVFREKQTFTISFTLLQFGTAWVKY